MFLSTIRLTCNLGSTYYFLFRQYWRFLKLMKWHLHTGKVKSFPMEGCQRSMFTLVIRWLRCCIHWRAIVWIRNKQMSLFAILIYKCASSRMNAPFTQSDQRQMKLIRPGPWTQRVQCHKQILIKHSDWLLKVMSVNFNQSEVFGVPFQSNIINFKKWPYQELNFGPWHILATFIAILWGLKVLYYLRKWVESKVLNSRKCGP